MDRNQPAKSLLKSRLPIHYLETKTCTENSRQRKVQDWRNIDIATFQLDDEAKFAVANTTRKRLQKLSIENSAQQHLAQ
jgi:hypothetical protein